MAKTKYVAACINYECVIEFLNYSGPIQYGKGLFTINVSNQRVDMLYVTNYAPTRVVISVFVNTKNLGFGIWRKNCVNY